MTVDQYTGKYLSLDKIMALDIPEIKIPRNLIRDIDVNQASLKALRELITHATKLGLQTSVVGVENKDQYFLIVLEQYTSIGKVIISLIGDIGRTDVVKQ